MPDSTTDLVRRERDLYARLLDAGTTDELDSVLSEALSVSVEQTHAKKGLIAVFAEGHEGGEPPRWLTARGFEDADLHSVMSSLSCSIIDDTLVTRRVSVIPSAMGHPRYGVRDSVRFNQITSVVCAPVGKAGLGVLYLQDRERGVFTEADEAWVKKLGAAIGRFVDHIVVRGHHADGDDPTAVWRRGGRFQRFVGQSPALATLFRRVVRTAQHDLPVLVRGAPGTGKRDVADELHALSSRATGPVIHMACGAVAPADMVRELVGSVGTERHTGLFEVARGGTLVIDDITRLSADAQRIVAHVISDKTYRPLGSALAHRADVRIVAVVGDDEAAIDLLDGNLIRQLRASEIVVPSLADRQEDMDVLVNTLGASLSAEQRVPWPGISDEALALISGSAWPGNVDELSRVLSNAISLTEGLRPIDVAELRSTLPPDDQSAARGPIVSMLEGPLLTWKEAKRRFASLYLDHALEVHDGNVAATARELGMSRARLFALRKELELSTDPTSLTPTR